MTFPAAGLTIRMVLGEADPTELDVLLVGWDGGGNVAPMVALGKRLRARGHRVRLLGPMTVRERALAGGIEHVLFVREPSWAPRPDRAIEDELGSFIAHLAGPEIGRELLDASQAERPSALVVDAMAAGALSAAERLGIPTAVLVHTRYRYFVSESGAAKWQPVLGLLNRTRAELELDPLAAEPGWLGGLWRRCGRVLVASLRELEGPGPKLAPAVRHVGPILDPAPEELPSGLAAFVRGGSAPLVVVSLSTTYMRQEGVLARIAGALRDTGVRAVITLGGLLDRSALPALGEGVVCEWVAHEALLPHADAAITHAGLGTTLCALASGVPLVCLPLGRDQPETAGRVTALGVGLALDREASPAEIARALEEVLSDRSYRRGARRLARRVEGLGRGEQAVELLEALAAQSGERTLQPATN